MNERIRELDEQASQYASKQTTDLDEWEFIFRKKFAELIVRECAELFDKNETEVKIPEHRVHNSIMIHFGLY
jgi:hypothetical protein